MFGKVTIAVAKGRILDELIPLLSELGITPIDSLETTRKLVLETNHANVKLIMVRAVDVPTYVEYGAANIGITGKDVLLEFGTHGFYELLDLQIAQCKMVVAAHKQKEGGHYSTRTRVATKYANITRNYFANQGKQIDIVKLYGSIELATILHLADQIVDLVDTGNTLRANGLVEIEHVMDVSSILIVNKETMKMQGNSIKPIIKQFSSIVDKQCSLDI